MTGGRSSPLVALFAHRLAAPFPTGIGRVAVDFVRAIDDRAAAAGLGMRFLVCSTPERGPMPFAPAHLSVRRVGPSRKALHLAWAAAHRPRIERFVGRVDLLHVLHPAVPVPSSAPVVYTIADLMPIHSPQWYGRIERWAFRGAVEDAAARAARVIVMSNTVADDVVSTLGVARERVVVIPHGISDAFRTDASDAERATVCARYGVEPGTFFVHVGNVAARKNLLPVVRALAAWPAAAAGAAGGAAPSLVLAGREADGAEQVRSEVARLRLDRRVLLPGYVPPTDLPVLVASAAALVHPSVDEGFGLTPVEAMAAGTPAVVSSAGSLPEVTGKAALVVDPHDDDAWLTALRSVVEDGALRARMVEAGRRQAAKYTWSATADATVALYRDVLGLDLSRS